MKSSDRSVFMSTIKSMYGDIDVISRPQVVAVAKKLGTKLPAWLTNDPSIRILRGMYSLKGAAPVTVATTIAVNTYAKLAGTVMVLFSL